MVKRINLVIILLFCILGIAIPPIKSVSAQIIQETISIGASPATIKNAFLTPGNIFEQEIVLSRSNPDSEATATFDIDAPTMLNWISFEPGQEINMAQGQQRQTVKVIFKVPVSAKLGNYQGSLRVKLGEANQSGQVILVPAVRIDLDLTVSNQYYSKLKVLQAKIPDTKIREPLKVIISVKNEGNQEDKPEKISLAIYNLKQTQVKGYEVEITETIPAFSSKDLEVTIENHNLEIANYMGNLDVYYQEKVIYNANLPFAINFNEQAFTSDLNYGDTQTQDGREQLQQLQTFLIGTFAILLSLVIFLWILNKRHENKSKN